MVDVIYGVGILIGLVTLLLGYQVVQHSPVLALFTTGYFIQGLLASLWFLGYGYLLARARDVSAKLDATNKHLAKISSMLTKDSRPASG